MHIDTHIKRVIRSGMRVEDGGGAGASSIEVGEQDPGKQRTPPPALGRGDLRNCGRHKQHCSPRKNKVHFPLYKRPWLKTVIIQASTAIRLIKTQPQKHI